MTDLPPQIEPNPMSQFHFDPTTYLDLMREEVPAYGRLQEAVAAVSEGMAVVRALDLGDRPA